MLKEEEILKGNKLIAEFLGYRVFNKRYPRNHGIGGTTLEIKDCILEKLKYHKDWNELMNVFNIIELLENGKYKFTIDPWSVEIIEYESGNEEVIVSIVNENRCSKFNMIYLTIIDFIEKYNE